MLNYQDDCEVLDVSQVDSAKTRKKDRAREHQQDSKRKVEKRGLFGEFSDSITGDDIPLEPETVREGGRDFPSGDEHIAALNKSNVAETGAVSEMIRRSLFGASTLFRFLINYGIIWPCTDICIRYLSLVAHRVDLTKYVARVAPGKGGVTLRWRRGERGDRIEKFTEIAKHLALNQKNLAFTYSCSGKLSAHKPGDVANNCFQRYRWRRCWLYGGPPEVHPPPSMPIHRNVDTAVLCSRAEDDAPGSSDDVRVPPRPWGIS